MTLQQLRYVQEVAQTGSISRAAQNLFVTQPSLSKAISDLETEMGITIFYRTNRGATLSEEGSRFLSYVRQIMDPVNLLEQQYKAKTPSRRIFGISSQHYAFVVGAFAELIREEEHEPYEFSLRESQTFQILEDVRTGRSELGVLFLSNFNRDVVLRMIHHSDLEFHPLQVASPHVFLSAYHPLAVQQNIRLDELTPYPRLTYEQGLHDAYYLSEELHSTEESPRSIVVTDRATLFNLVNELDGYTIASGALSSSLNGEEIVAIPLESEEQMEIGYVSPVDRPLSPLAKRYLEKLEEYLKNHFLA